MRITSARVTSINQEMSRLGPTTLIPRIKENLNQHNRDVLEFLIAVGVNLSQSSFVTSDQEDVFSYIIQRGLQFVHLVGLDQSDAAKLSHKVLKKYHDLYLGQQPGDDPLDYFNPKALEGRLDFVEPELAEIMLAYRRTKQPVNDVERELMILVLCVIIEATLFVWQNPA